MRGFNWWSNWLRDSQTNRVAGPLHRTAILAPEERVLQAWEVEQKKTEDAARAAELAATRQRDAERDLEVERVRGDLAIARQEATEAIAQADEAEQVLIERRSAYEALRDAHAGRESDPIAMGTLARAVMEGQRIAAEVDGLRRVSSGWDAKVTSLEAAQRALVAADLQGAGMSVANAEWAAAKTWEEHQIEDGKGPEERQAERRELAAQQRMASWLTPAEGARAMAEWERALDELTALREVRLEWEREPVAMVAGTESAPARETGLQWQADQQHAMAQLAGLQQVADRAGWEAERVEFDGPHERDNLDAAREMLGLATEETAPADATSTVAEREEIAVLTPEELRARDAAALAEMRAQAIATGTFQSVGEAEQLDRVDPMADLERLHVAPDLDAARDLFGPELYFDGSPPPAPDAAASAEIASRTMDNDQREARERRAREQRQEEDEEARRQEQRGQEQEPQL